MLSAALAQQVLVRQLLSWPLVEARLEQFPAIARAFPHSLLLNRRDTKPYFCHYMAWRLGTCQDERLVLRLNELLENAESLPNWKREQALIKGGDFADFWSLIWQLQVAEYLSDQGIHVSWNGAGPDLSAEVDGQRLFVECYVYRKSFGAVLFIEELIQGLGTDLRVSYDSCLPLSLPNDRASLSIELSSLMAPLVDSQALAAKRSLAQRCYPVVLSRASQGTLAISLEGPEVKAYDPLVLPQNVGEPTEYLEVALREAANAKSNSNRLASCRPNLVVVNYALSADAQMALASLRESSHSLPHVNLSENVDALAFATRGIDSVLLRQDLKLVVAKSERHPAHAITVPAT